MQLKKPGSIRNALTVATYSLLSSSPATAIAEDSNSEWLFDSAVLKYSEKGRVEVTEPVISFKKIYQVDESIEYKLVYDAMTGASPNGATPADTPQVFTGASGKSECRVEANETPLCDFSDQRVAFSVVSEKPIHETLGRTYGAALSIEGDYVSLGINANYKKDLNNKLTTMTTGLAVNLDLIAPIGGTPQALTNINEPTPTGGGGGDENEDEDEDEGEEDTEVKMTFDIFFGITQIVNRRTLMQFNYSHGTTRGYQTDPYKVVSEVDPTTGGPIVTESTAPEQYKHVHYYEKRPDERDTNSLFWKTVVNLGQDVIRVSYRYFWDDWGIKSHTLELKYRWELPGRFFLQPHYRYYQQTAADFYRHSLLKGETMPEYVSADFRLAEMESQTIGIKFGTLIGESAKLDIRWETLEQTGDSYPKDAIGDLKKQNLYPTLEASIVQISFSAKF